MCSRCEVRVCRFCLCPCHFSKAKSLRSGREDIPWLLNQLSESVQAWAVAEARVRAEAFAEGFEEGTSSDKRRLDGIMTKANAEAQAEALLAHGEAHFCLSCRHQDAAAAKAKVLRGFQRRPSSGPESGGSKP